MTFEIMDLSFLDAFTMALLLFVFSLGPLELEGPVMSTLEKTAISSAFAELLYKHCIAKEISTAIC